MLRRQPLARAIALVLGYMACFWAVRLVFLSVVTYTIIHSPDSSNQLLQKIGDVVRANQVLTYGFSALIFIGVLQALHPLTQTQFRRVFDMKTMRHCFATNALNGAILVIVMILGTMLGGHMSYLGVYMKFDEVMMSLGSAAVFGFCLFVLAIVEEYILRECLERRLAEHSGSIGVSFASCCVFLFIRYAQFDLNWLETVNLALLNLILSMIARTERSYMASAAFEGTFLVVTHVFFGLPFMGQDMPGLFLLRASGDDNLSSLLSGGATGPEAGLVLSVLLLVYLYLPQIRSRRIEV